ncbi:negative elongation factor A, partial [Paragonimus westermani]
MGDLQKFIRQHFFDNQWTREVDPTTLSEEKWVSIDSAFCNIDVKSKLCLLLSFCHLKPSLPPEINKHIENIFLQALDEENNLVKAVATILHSKQSLNYLNFDISPTNEAFRKNIQRLLKSSADWRVVGTPLLAEFLGEGVLALVSNGPLTKHSVPSTKRQCASSVSGPVKVNPSFRCRGKPQSASLKESYLERLKDECQRRRVHVPIPGRSFARSEEADDDHDLESSGFLGSQMTIPRRSLTPGQNKKGGVAPSSWSQSSDNSGRNLVGSWSRSNQDAVPERSNEVRSAFVSEKLAARFPAAANFRKSSGIKLLDFDELPAFGPKAKQLRKEQMEKEREVKRQEREDRLKEQKAAREASKRARQAERQALVSRSHAPVSSHWPALPSTGSDMPITSIPGAISIDSQINTSNGRWTRSVYGFPEFSDNVGQPMENPYPFACPTATTVAPGQLITLEKHGGSCFMARHPLLSVSTGVDVVPSVTDDDDEDDDDDGEMMPDSRTGLYNLGVSTDFRGFNPSARVQIRCTTSRLGTTESFVPGSTNAVESSTQNGSIPLVLQSSTTSDLHQLPPHSTCTSTSLSTSVTPSSATLLVSNSCGIPSTQSTAPTTIKVVSGTHLSPVVRIIQPSQVSSVRADILNKISLSAIHSTAQNTTSPAVGIGDVEPQESQNNQAVFTRAVPITRLRQLITTTNSTVTTTTFTTLNPNLVRIAPRPAGLVQLTPPNSSVGLQPRLIQQPVDISLAPSHTPSAIQRRPQPASTATTCSMPHVAPVLSGLAAGTTNTAWMFDRRQLILTPVVSVSTPQSPPRVGVLSPTRSTIQSPPTTGYVQILPRPTGSLSFSTNDQQPFSVVQVESSTAHNSQTNVNPCTLTESKSFAFYDTATAPTTAAMQPGTSEQNVSAYPAQFSSNLMLSTNSTAFLNVPSAVKIQDDLCLTEAQLSSVQSLFQGANRVSRPEKAMIVSFIAGARGNPRPETGNTLRIRLSEYRERVLNQATGQLVDVAADTYLHMDYSTGTCEKAQSSVPEGFIGPLCRAEYEQLHARTDKPDLLAEVDAEANEQAEFERTDEREATQAAREVWAPLQPPYIDAHFSTWTLSSAVSLSQLYLGGKMPPPPTAFWGRRLQRDFTADDYEEEMDYMRARAEAEIKYEVGELSPIRYAIHVQVASTYSESLMVSSLAEDYYCIAGYVSWCDLSDPSLSDHLQHLNADPLLVGLRYDVSDLTDGDFLLDSMIDSNFAAIEHVGLPFDLVIGPHQLRHACHLAYRHPRLKLVLNHCGLPLEYTASRTGE